MTMKQILFILDKNNYNIINHVDFRKKFEAVNDNSGLKLSNDLKKF